MDHVDALAAERAQARTDPLTGVGNRREYEDIKRSLQIELLKLQSWVKETGQRIVLRSLPAANVVTSQARLAP